MCGAPNCLRASCLWAEQDVEHRAPVKSQVDVSLLDPEGLRPYLRESRQRVLAHRSPTPARRDTAMRTAKREEGDRRRPRSAGGHRRSGGGKRGGGHRHSDADRAGGKAEVARGGLEEGAAVVHAVCRLLRRGRDRVHLSAPVVLTLSSKTKLGRWLLKDHQGLEDPHRLRRACLAAPSPGQGREILCVSTRRPIPGDKIQYSR